MWLISTLIVAALGQSDVSKHQPTLDWPATKKLLKAAEREIAAFRMTQPQVRRVEEHVLARILRGVPNALMIAQSGNRVQSFFARSMKSAFPDDSNGPTTASALTPAIQAYAPSWKLHPASSSPGDSRPADDG